MHPSNRPPLRATLLGPDIEHRRSLEAMLDKSDIAKYFVVDGRRAFVDTS